MRTSNHLIGLLNFLTFLLSIPILGSGIWLSSRANTTDCLRFLQWPIIVIGASIMVISLAGFAGACYRNTFLMAPATPVMNRAYLEYRLDDYSGWLEERVSSTGYWSKIRACIRDSKVCAKMGRNIGGVPESADAFYLRKLSPIQSGCCKPPTECGNIYVNETVWTIGGGLVGSSLDCNRWSNDQQQLCYDCDSCKAGVLASLKKSWRKVSVINIVILIILVIVYVVACVAFRHNRKIDNDEPYGETRMEKAQPSRIHF
ncbi:tetraspanin4 [Actinidia rufa]|uniref:Tetraspanin4 n=1 Tax=Actinidia rufa TaxID=165716 RepID=A0A7J0H4A6_9ERIC|nr:tetraspanin4 [Actinidia rufa]